MHVQIREMFQFKEYSNRNKSNKVKLEKAPLKEPSDLLCKMRARKQKQNFWKRVPVPAKRRIRKRKNKEKTHIQRKPKAPFKPTLSELIEFTIIREETDTPVTGTNNLMSDQDQVCTSAEDHFNLVEKALRITKPTASIPTFQVCLHSGGLCKAFLIFSLHYCHFTNQM